MYRTVVEERTRNIVVMDVFSKLIEDRIIFIDDVISDELASSVISQMLYLDSLNHQEIRVYINSPGGSVTAGLGIYDVGKLLKAPIKTVCIGLAASMGAILMLMGTKRCITKNSRLMLHQPSGGVIGTATEIETASAEIQRIKHQLYGIIANETNITDFDKITLKDYWIDPEEALKLGLVTEIL